MSNNKHFADLLKVCSILPALAIMPAMAGVEDYIWNPNFDSYTLEADEKLPNPDSVENAQFNGMRSPTGKFELDGSNFTLDANGWAGLSVGADEEFNMHDFKIVKNFEKAASGGAFLSITGGVLTIDNVHFMNNSSAGGGAIASGAASAQDGGQAADVAISNSKFTANSATSSGGAISNNASLLKLSNVDFVGNMSGRDGGAVDNNNGGILEISNGAVFKNNIATQNGGAIFAGDVSVIGDILFEENEALNAGAVHVGDKSFVVKKDAQGNDNTVTFKKNVATGNAGAFFVGANGTVDITATNIDFIENSGASNGGTIYVQDGTLKLLGENNTFFNNQSTKSEKTYKRGGGVIHNQINSAGSTIVIGGSENSINSFTYNKAVVNGGAILSRGDGNGYESNMTLNGTTVFEENDAGMNGGALYQYVNAKDTMNVVFNGNVDFDDNNAGENGGAIFNYSSVDGIASIKFNGEVEFENNIAGQNGGAIYNNGTLDLSKAESTFVGNKANESGGAIYNQGALTLNDAEFKGNSVTAGDGGAIRIDVTNGAKTVIKDSEFSENKALGYASADSGAISIRNGDVKIADSEFDKNEAMFGGAMYLYTGNNHYVSVDINETKFEGNKALAGGAIVSVASNKNNENGGLRLTDVKFNANNASDNEGDGGGALFLGAQSQTYITRGVFNGNTSAAVGGAISMRDGDSGNNKDAKLDIVDSVFANNEAATQGGAIYSTFYNSVQEIDNVYLGGSSFVNNKANEGGAIYNEGNADLGNNFASMKLENVSFVGNTASDKGGAIFNGADAVINMSGVNTFVNNIANKGANDIYNAGTLNITGGETTIGGGILGNGTLTLAEGAVLNIGNATIRQNNLDIDGIVKVSVLSDRSYGRLIAAEKLDVAESAELHLSLGSVGEYDMFGGKDAGFSTIKYGDTYNVTELGGGIIKVETKSVEQLAQDTGLTTQAAGVVAGLANSHDATLQHISLVAQQALNAGDKALVEQETKKLNPEEKPVVQAVASAVQNQVLSLASGRMAGGVAMGRAGGDSSQENGFWMHGLFNKSKLDDQFHGYTRGVAFGMDTIIDGKYILGGGLAFNNSDVHSSGRGDIDIDSKTLFLYGQYKPNNWFANMTLTYNMSEYDETKSVFGYNINNIYDVDSYGAQIMGGYDFNTGITTEAGLRYLHIDQDAYADISATKTDFLTSVAGIKYAFAIENDWEIKLQPELRAALTYDIISEADVATIDMPGVASYKVAGENLDRLGGEFVIGLTAYYKGLKVTLMYDLDLHKDYTSQTGMIKFRTQF